MVHDELQPSSRDAQRPAAERPTDRLLTDGLRLSPGYLLARLGAESRARWARMLAERDLTPHHFGVMTALAAVGETHQQRLAAAIGVDARNVVAIIDGLSQRGLLERLADPRDRRKHRIRLTANGTAAVVELRAAGTVIEDEMFRALTAADRNALHGLLLKLADDRGT